MKKRNVILAMTVAVSSLFMTACDTVSELATTVLNSSSPLTESEVGQGLKRALEVGAGTAVGDLSSPNDFLSNAAYKILLPKEAQIITDNKDNPLLKAVGVSKMIDDVEQSMNAAAANAVTKAKPIFVKAITGMSIQDAFGILRGGDNAATNYLRKTTYQSLYNAFKPEISKSLGKPLYQGMSANNAWGSLTGAYNKVATYVPNWQAVNTSLDDYVTNKALDALFKEVQKEEANIRKNPAARVDALLQRVFGSK